MNPRARGRHVEVRVDRGLPAAFEASTPSPGTGELLVATRAAALGPDDLKAFEGCVLSGEFAGDVLAVGPDVASSLVGSAVAVLGYRPCARCHRCLDGVSTACADIGLRGRTTDGGLSGAVLVRTSDVIVLPPGLSHEQAALMHRVASALRALHRGPASPGEAVAILGGTPLALATCAVVLAAGSGRTAFVDDHAGCRAVMEHLGARSLERPSEASGWEDLAVWLGGYGADVVYECAGSAKSRLEAVELARPAGSVVLLAHDDTPVTMDLNLIVMGAKRVRGSRLYALSDGRVALDLIARSLVNAAALVGRTVSILDVLADPEFLNGFTDCRATIVQWPASAEVNLA